MVERKVILVTQFGKFEVNSYDLAENLKRASIIARKLVLRPGQIIDSPESKNPVSLEKAFTLKTIVN